MPLPAITPFGSLGMRQGSEARFSSSAWCCSRPAAPGPAWALPALARNSFVQYPYISRGGWMLTDFVAAARALRGPADRRSGEGGKFNKA